MSLQDLFYDWYNQYIKSLEYQIGGNTIIVLRSWEACAELMQAEIDRQAHQLKALRGFANKLCESVFDGGSLDGSDIQDMMLEHGLLIAEIMNEPCEKGSSRCRCQEYCSSEDFKNGVECYRKTPVLKENANVVDI